MKSRFLSVFAMLAGIALCGSAETPAEKQLELLKKDHHIIHLEGGEQGAVDTVSEQELINTFYYDQFRHFQDPRAPYFMLMSKTRKYAMGIGGVVRMRGWYDWNGAMPNAGFTPYNISIPRNPTKNNWYGTTPAGTALFFSVFGRNNTYGQYQLYIEGNFSGYDSRGFKLKKAYATVNDWTLGYTTSTFQDPAAQPPTLDAQGPNSKTGSTNMLLRWMHTMKSHWVVALSVETPSSSITSKPDFYTGCSDYMPDFAGFVQYQWGSSSHVRLSGIVRGLKYRDLVSERNYRVAGWGAHASAVFTPVSPLTVYGAFLVGKGVSSLNNDLQNGAGDLIGNPNQEGRMYAPMSLGWYGAMSYHFKPNLFSTVIFGEERFLPKYNPNFDNLTYKYGLYATANVIWDITPRCEVGLEYNIGKRQNIDLQHRWADRLCFMAQFSF